jgi:hypothetical protein
MHGGGAWESDLVFGIVEGEPGIFPDPIARLLRLLRSPLRHRRASSPPAPGTAPSVEPPAVEPPDGEPPEPDGADGAGRRAEP